MFLSLIGFFPVVFGQETQRISSTRADFSERLFSIHEKLLKLKGNTVLVLILIPHAVLRNFDYTWKVTVDLSFQIPNLG